MVDEGYHKAKDAWQFVKPYAEIAQEKGTELFHKVKESSEIVLDKGTELFYKAKEGEQSEIFICPYHMQYVYMYVDLMKFTQTKNASLVIYVVHLYEGSTITEKIHNMQQVM